MKKWKEKKISGEPSKVCCDHMILISDNEVILLESKPQKSSHASDQLFTTEKNLRKAGIQKVHKKIVFVTAYNQKKYAEYKRDYGYACSKIKKKIKVYIVPIE